MTMTAAKAGISRWHVTSRVVAAVLPAFILANTTGILITLAFPWAQATALAWAFILSYPLWTAAVIWVFAVKKLRTVWLGLTGAIAVTGGAAAGLYLLETGP
jgi:hypothetical protein